MIVVTTTAGLKKSFGHGTYNSCPYLAKITDKYSNLDFNSNLVTKDHLCLLAIPKLTYLKNHMII